MPCHAIPGQARPCPNDACAARSLHHLEPALLFLLSASHTSPSSFHLFLFNPFPSPSSTEFRIRRFSTSLVANSSSFVDVWIQVLRVSLSLLFASSSLLCRSFLCVPTACLQWPLPPSRSRLYIRSTFTSLEGSEKLLSGPLYHIEKSFPPSRLCIFSFPISSPVSLLAPVE